MIDDFNNNNLKNKKSEEELAKESAFYKDYLREQEEKAERERRLKREEEKRQQEQANNLKSYEVNNAQVNTNTQAIEKNKSIEESVKNKKVKQRKKRTFATIGLTTIVLGLGAGVGYALLNQPSYEIDCVSNNENSVLTGEGKYKTGTVVNLGTIDIEGYRFKAWYFNDEIVSNEKEFSFKMDPSKSGTYYVVYEKLYTIEQQQVSNGEVVIDKTNAVKGELVTITATPNANYSLSKMYYIEEGSTTQTTIQNSCFVMPEQNVKVYVEFSEIEYQIQTGELSCGTIEPDKMEATMGSKVNVSILLNDGYQIKRVYYCKNGSLVKNDLTFDDGYYFEMPDTNVCVYLDYELINYTINLDFDGGVSSNAEQITYNVESETFIIAQPVKKGYRFVGWTNVATTEEYLDTTIETGSIGNLSLKANYEIIDYAIAKGSVANGNIDVVTTANYGDNISVTVQADLGYGLSELYYILEGDTQKINIVNNSFEMPDSNITIYAVFEEGSYSIVCQKDGQGVLSASKLSAKQNEEIIVTATPSVGYRLNKLVYVIDDDVNEIEIVDNKFNMPIGNLTIYAEFVVVDYNVEKGIETNGEFTVSKTVANYGDELTISISPDEGYEIENIYYIVEGSSTKYTITNLSFTMPANNVTVYVEFEAITYSVNNGSSSDGTINISGSTTTGSQVQVEVTPNPGYVVDDMYYIIDGDDTHYPINDNSFVMPPGDVTVYVDFKLIDYTITKADCDNGSFAISKSVANINDSISVQTSPNEGYQLKSMYYIKEGTDTKVDISSNTFLMPDANVTVYVEYKLIDYTVLVGNFANGTITLQKQTANFNEEIEVEVIPNSGYLVGELYYIASGTTVKVNITDNKFTMPSSSITLYADFVAIDYIVTTATASNGSFVVSKTEANVGDTINVTTTPDRGYSVKRIYYVIDGEQTENVITSNITMPANNITVYAEFEAINYTITKSTTQNGSVEVSKTTAVYNDSVTVSVTPNTDYELEEIYYIIDSTQQKVTITGSEFVMPDENITIYATFKESILLTMNVDGDSTSYKVNRGDVLSSVVPNIDTTNAKTNNEYTCGLYLDENLTEEADLTASITTSITLYTKKATLSNLTFTYQSASSSYIATIATSATDVVLPLEYNQMPVIQIKGGTNTTSIVLSKNISSLGGYRLSADLATIKVCGGNETFVAEGNCLIAIATKILVLGTINSVIPADGSVTIISANAFQEKKIANIVIPDCITKICTGAFKWCTKLTTVDLGNDVKEIGYDAFRGCALTTLTLPSGLVTIEENAFYGSGLNEVEFNDGLQSIGDSAFGSTDLISVELPNTITSFGVNPFSDCCYLESIVMNGDNSSYYTVDNCLIYKPTKKLVSGCKKSTIPGDGEVLILGEDAFLVDAYYSIISKVPEGVTTLEKNCLNKNKSINNTMYASTCVLPSTITSIDPEALGPSLTISIIENSVYYSKDNCIIKKSNKELVRIGREGVIPSDGEVLIIGSYAFEMIGTRGDLVIPEGVTTINEYAFTYSSYYEKIILPSTITSYSSNAMYRACGVEEIVIYSEAVYKSFIWGFDTNYYNQELIKLTILASVADGSNTTYIENTSKFPYQYKNAIIDNEVYNVYYVTKPTNFYVATLNLVVGSDTYSYQVVMEGVVPSMSTIIPTEISNQVTDGLYLEETFETLVDTSLYLTDYIDSLNGELTIYVK